MMARTVPILRDGLLTDQHQGVTRTIAVGTPAWDHWLSDATAFVVEQEGVTFTARKERAGNRRGGWYWRAYRTRDGIRRRAYLGKADDLTLTRLHEAAALLADYGQPDPAHVAPTASAPRIARRHPPAPAVGQRAASGGRARDISSARRYHPALLATKLSPPPVRPSAVARSRLHDHLRQATRHKLVLVSAPAGSGKTTVLSAWATTPPASCGVGNGRAPAATPVPAPPPVAWLSLDDGDNDPTSFWTYCVAALDTVQPGIGDAARALLSSAQPASPHTMLTVLINALGTLPDDVVLVLDDYHLIETPAVHEAMAFLLDHLPPRLHLLIATRADPALPLARLRARNELLELRAADLRFTEGEAADFLGRTMGLTLPEGDIAALAARTEGWVAGLQLAALSRRGHEDSDGFVTTFAGDNRHILDYLAEEVLARQPDHVRAFLLRTCILDRLTGPLCDALTARSDSQDTLALLERENLFIAPLDHQRTWYRYHHLFAEALRAMARQALPDQLPALHLQASRWYEGHGLTRAAIDHAIAAADMERVTALIEGLADGAIWAYGEVETLRRWLAALTEPVVRSRPQLCILHAWTLHYALWTGAVDPVAAGATLDRIDARLRDAQRWLTPADESPHARTMRGEVAALSAILSFYMGEIPRVKEPACLALDLLPRENTTLRLLAARMLYNLYSMHGDATMIERAVGELTTISRTAHDALGAINALLNVADAQTMRGELRQAAAAHRRALRHAERELRTVAPASPHRIGLGGLLLEWGDLAGAEDQLTQGIASLEERGDPTVLVEAYRSLASLRQAQGDDAGALAALAGEDRVIARSPQFAQYLVSGLSAAWRAWLALLRGDVRDARRWAETCAWEEEEQLTSSRGIELTIAARIYLAHGEVAVARPLVVRLLGIAEDAGRTDRVIDLLALHALAQAAGGDEAGAIGTLARALALAEPGGYVRTFTREGAPMARLLARVLEIAQAGGDHAPAAPPVPHTVSPTYVRTLLTALGWPVPAPGEHARPPALSEREREIVRLMARGDSNREIAHHLMLAESTVKTYTKRLYAKLGVRNRTQAVTRAGALRLL